MKVNRVARLFRVIAALRSGRSYDADGLARELSVSRRTLFRDLKLLEHSGVPYRFDHRNGRYAISDSVFLPAMHLEMEEALALLMLTRKFLSRRSHPMHGRALSAALKIESALPAPVLRHCGHMLDGIAVAYPPTADAESASDVFDKLYRALGHRRRLRVRYDSVFDRKEIETMLDPLRVVFISRGWYLIALSHMHGQIRTFKVDRMLDVKVLDETFEPADGGFDESAYFGNAWSMIPDGRVYSVKLRFDANVAASVEEVLWHPTQSTLREPDGRLVFEAKVDGLREISSWILGYGGQVEVLEPKELRGEVRRRAEALVERCRRADAGAERTCA